VLIFYSDLCARVSGKKMSVIFQMFPGNEGNSRAIDRILGESREIQAIFIGHIFRVKVSSNA